MAASAVAGRPPDPITAILMTEKERVDPSLTQIHQVVQEEIDRRSGLREPEYLEVDIPKPIKLSKKVLVPLHRNPGFNYIGKLMGPGGATMKKLQEKHNVKIHVCGRGSSKDKSKEQELYLTGDPKYSHFGENLHIKVDVVAPPVDAFRRMASALEDVKAHFNPDLTDEISKAQIEQGFVPNQNTQSSPSSRARGGPGGGRGGGPNRGGAPPRGRGGMMGQRGRGTGGNVPFNRGGGGMGPGRGGMGQPRPPAPPQAAYQGNDYGGGGNDSYGANTSSVGYYNSYGQPQQQHQQQQQMQPQQQPLTGPPNMGAPNMPMRPPVPRQTFGMPPRAPGLATPPRPAPAMGMMNARPPTGAMAPGPSPATSGPPRMMMGGGQNGMPMNVGGKMSSGGQMRGGFRMHPYNNPGVARPAGPYA